MFWVHFKNGWTPDVVLEYDIVFLPAIDGVPVYTDEENSISICLTNDGIIMLDYNWVELKTESENMSDFADIELPDTIPMTEDIQSIEAEDYFGNYTDTQFSAKFEEIIAVLDNNYDKMRIFSDNIYKKVFNRIQ